MSYPQQPGFNNPSNQPPQPVTNSPQPGYQPPQQQKTHQGYQPSPLPAPHQQTQNTPQPVYAPIQPGQQPQNPGYSQYGLMNPQYYAQPVGIQPQMGSPYNNGPLIPAQYMQQMQKSRTVTTLVLILGSVLVAILFALTSLAGGGAISFFLALIPLSIVVGSTFWIGKWDPEPLFMRILAFVWGAIGSILITFLIAGIWETFIPSTMFVSLAIQAPVVEEFSKGIFVLAIALFFKKYMNSPIDGVVYMMLAAGGFAFTENILYFVSSVATSGAAGLGMTFLLRGVMSPFAHALFSLPMGILLGLGVRKNMKALGLIGLFIGGWFFAMLLHSLWNGSSSLITNMGMWFLFYAVVQIPLFIGAIFIIRWLRGQEAARTYKYITEYAWSGWFTAEEVATFGTWNGRKHILKWAKTRSPQALYLVKTMNKEIVELANAREDIVSQINVQANVNKENAMLLKLDHDRKLLAKL